ncbi:lysozyme inhibitor LprI family protein [Candidatus Liberibacter brunswickensis]|uniref:lysozyme inhibitor LprI family protein n=1 Tax=Candidatus Liberibacter brunswickensis TaxID=1968796 RepID=UPI002FE0FBF1
MFKKTIFLITITIAFQSMAFGSEKILNQKEMNNDAENTYNIAKEELKVMYEKVLSKIKDHQKELFEKSQNVWKQYSDSECNFASFGFKKGSSVPMVYANCLHDHIIKRNERLKYYLTCPEGDLNCPFINN